MGIIRFLLAIAVLFGHFPSIADIDFTFGSPDVSVEIFFIISGFYMALILSARKYSLSGFYKSRFLRLFPAYYIILIMTVLFMKHPFANFYGKSIGAVLMLAVTNLIILGQDATIFFGINHTGSLFFNAGMRNHIPFGAALFVPQAWSISLEIMFYFIIPLLFFRKNRIVIISSIVVLSMLLRSYIFLHLHFDYDPWSYRFFPNEICFFLLGVLAFLVYENVQKRKIQINKSLSLMMFGVALTSTFGYDYFFGGTHLNIYFYHLTMLICIPFIFDISKNWKVDRFIGELSYPVYISHFLMIVLTSYILHALYPLDAAKYHHLFQPIAMIMTIAVSLVLYLFIQKPIDNFRHRYVSARDEEKLHESQEQKTEFLDNSQGKIVPG